MALAPGEARKDLSADALFQVLHFAAEAGHDVFGTRISLPTPSSKFSAPISALFPTTVRARSKSPCTTS